MLFTEFNLEDAKQVWFEEGCEEKGLKIAQAMFAEGFNLETIFRITGIPLETLKETLIIQ